MANLSWKDFKDDWNIDIINLDNYNKSIVSKNTDIIEVILDNKETKDEKTDNINFEINNETLKNIISNASFNSFTDVENLHNIAKVINWTINNCLDLNKDNYNNFLDAISWTYNCINYFITELKIPEPQNKFSYTLVRSSYKLCPQKSNCVFQYPDNINVQSCCKFQHFPYSNLYTDCTSIYAYIKQHFESNEGNSKSSRLINAVNNNDINYGELKRCLTTINFVIMIMYREVDTIIKCRSCEPNFNIRNFHCYHPVYKFDDKKKQTNKQTNTNRKQYSKYHNV